MSGTASKIFKRIAEVATSMEVVSKGQGGIPKGAAICSVLLTAVEIFASAEDSALAKSMQKYPAAYLALHGLLDMQKHGKSLFNKQGEVDWKVVKDVAKSLASLCVVLDAEGKKTEPMKEIDEIAESCKKSIETELDDAEARAQGILFAASVDGTMEDVVKGELDRLVAKETGVNREKAGSRRLT